MERIDLTGQTFGQLEVVEEAAPAYWRCRCLRCQYGGALATLDALLAGKVKICFDCNALAKMPASEKTLLAFKRSLDLTPEWEVLGNVPSIHGIPRLTIADALGEAA